MSINKRHFYAATPSTTRGKPTLLGGDPKNKENILYTVGSTVVIRSLKNPLIADTYTEHSHPATVARYAPSGFYIASADVAGNVRVWDCAGEDRILKLEIKALGGPILDLQWSDDSKRIVAVGEGRDKFGVAFFADSGASVGEIGGHGKTITTCAFKQTRPYRVATGSEDNQVNWFEGPPFKFKKSLKDHQRFVNCVRFNPQGELLISVASDKKGILYDGKDGGKVGELSAEGGHNGSIFAVDWSPDGKQILTASGDKTVKIWDAGTQKLVNTFTFGSEIEDQQVGCLWQGDYIVSLSLSGDINYLDPKSPAKPSQILKGHNKIITSLAYDKQNKHLFTGSYDAVINRWNFDESYSTGFTGKGHTNQVSRAWVQGGNLITIGMDDSARVTSLSNLTYGADKIPLEGTPTDLAVGSQSQDLRVAVTVSGINVIRGGKVVQTTSVQFEPTAVAINPSENEVAVGGKNNQIYIYSLSGDKISPTKTLALHRGAITSLQYAPNGSLLAAGDSNREINVWDTKKGEAVITGWQFHSARVTSLAWASNSQKLASVGLDQNIIVWDTKNTGERITLKNTHVGGVTNVLWIDDNTLATTGQDCFLKTWNVKF